MIATSYTVMTPRGQFIAEWDEDEDIPVQYSGSAEAMAYFQTFLALETVTGRNGVVLAFEAMEPADLYGFCQSSEYGIVVLPEFGDLISMLKDDEATMGAVFDAVDDSQAFTLIGEGAQLLKRLDEDSATFFDDLSRLREILQLLGAAEPAKFDPLSEDGYAKVLADPALQARYQDTLDAFFQSRIIEVRNALRELGWEGARGEPLLKNGLVLDPVFKQVGAGRNVVGIDYRIKGVQGFYMSDPLSLSAEELAGRIDLGLPRVEPGDLAPEGRENAVKTAKGTKVSTGFTVIEAQNLIISHDADGNPNPEYPQELQPRDRARTTSQAWVLKTARNLDPDSLGRTQRADSGAPIVGPDRVVESGNGRAMAIREAYRIGAADEYREWLLSEADYFGVNAAKIRSMKAPVLVRVRTSEVNRAEFAVEANQDDKLSMTATEKARSDAKRLTEAVIAKLADGDLTAAANRDFIAAFLQSLGDAEAAQYLTTDGKPTASLISRVQAAIFAKAYNDDRLLELTADSAKPEIANIINALNMAAPDFIRAQEADRVTAEDSASRLTDSVELSLNGQAVQAIIAATNVLQRAKDSGMGLEEFLNQGDMFGGVEPSVAAMALFIHKNNRSARRMGTAFKAMAEFVKSENERKQTAGLFGDADAVGFTDIVAAANRKLEQEYGEGLFAIDQGDMFAPGPAPAATLDYSAKAAELIAGFSADERDLLRLGIGVSNDATKEAEAAGYDMKQLRLALMEAEAKLRAELEADPLAAARDVIQSREFKALAKDFTQSLTVIRGVDEGTEKGWDRSLFVSSITGKLTRLAKNNSLLTAVLLAWLFETQKDWKKPAITLRNGVWNLVQDWEQYRVLFQKAAEVDPAPTPDVTPQPEPAATAEQDEPSNTKPAQTSAATIEDPALTQAKELLQSVIDGTADMLDPELADRMVSAAETYPELSDLVEQAATAYSDFMVKEAQAAMA